MTSSDTLMARVLGLPLILVLTGLFALAMFVPALHALALEDHSDARTFFYSCVLGLVLVLLIGLAISERDKSENSDLQNLASLFLAYTVLPLFLALPLYEAIHTTRFLNAYFEMVSALTTTGATVFDDPARLTDSQHLWRGLVGWLGGLMIWISASAILAPPNHFATRSNDPGASSFVIPAVTRHGLSPS